MYAKPRDTWMFTGKDSLEEQRSMLPALIDNISINTNDNTFLRGKRAQLMYNLYYCQRQSMLLNRKCLVAGTLIGYHPQQVFLLVNYIYIIMCINYTIEIMYL
uniref:AlNc14C608G12236 protein n=1 Tax=Albugo laibachii Nc14 TaxID=890382 RepID=F0X1E5_9STRA|nr:AlNc14C608G12236 [Albugo laibachii Nc14]|eukprot:CCA27623.1 AlNc14C608G12236 [Albugo laibachii Nc14]